MTQSHQGGRRVAVLGTGIMGGPIARHLSAAGFAVAAWDIDSARLATLAEHGVLACTSAGEALQGASVLLTMLTDAPTTAAVLDGALSGFEGLWVQSATVGIDGTADLLALAGRERLAFVDCPLLGTRASAEAAELTALASGPGECERAVREVLAPCAPRLLWLGPAGQGTRLKLVMNNWVIGLTELTAETITLAHGLGFAGEDFLGLIAGGPLDVAQAHIKGLAMERDDFTPALPLRHAAKDASLIHAAARELGLALPLAQAHAEAFARAVEAGHGDEDVAAIVRTIDPRHFTPVIP